MEQSKSIKKYKDDLNIKNNNKLINNNYLKESGKTSYKEILNSNIYSNFLNKSNKKNNKNKNILLNMIIRRNKKKKFRNGILKLDINKDNNRYENNNNNDFSLVVNNTIYYKFKLIPNIKKYHNLSNEKLLQLTMYNDDNCFITHKQKKNNYYCFNEYLKNISLAKKNKSEKKGKLIFTNYKINKKTNKTFNAIKQNLINSNVLDINYEINFHKSWCNLFKKNSNFNSPKNVKKHLYNKCKLIYQNTMTPNDSTIVNNIFTNEKKNSSKSIILNEKKEINNYSNNNPKINNFIFGQKPFRRGSAIGRLLFKLTNKDECYEDYVSDGRPSDKYALFKRQIEKNKKYIEKQLLELRRCANTKISI